jgi:hypothetical protein
MQVAMNAFLKYVCRVGVLFSANMYDVEGE